MLWFSCEESPCPVGTRELRAAAGTSRGLLEESRGTVVAAWALEVTGGEMVRSGLSRWNLKVKRTGVAGRLIAETACRIKDDARAFGLSSRKDEVTV